MCCFSGNRRVLTLWGACPTWERMKLFPDNMHSGILLSTTTQHNSPLHSSELAIDRLLLVFWKVGTHVEKREEFSSSEALCHPTGTFRGLIPKPFLTHFTPSLLLHAAVVPACFVSGSKLYSFRWKCSWSSCVSSSLLDSTFRYTGLGNGRRWWL